MRALRCAATSDHPRACGGTLGSVLYDSWETRIIPAHAGELAIDDAWLLEPFGSSPRMRGTLSFMPFEHWILRIIPAHAGNS